MFYYNTYDDRFIHQNMDIPENYKKVSLHIALERADIAKDWIVFKQLYKLNPKMLSHHMNMTDCIFNYNFYKLSKEEQNNLLN